MDKFNKWFYIKPFSELHKTLIKDKLNRLNTFEINTVYFYAIRFTSLNKSIIRITETAMLPQENDRLISIEDALYTLDLALVVDKESLYNIILTLSNEFDIKNLSLIQQDVKK